MSAWCLGLRALLFPVCDAEGSASAGRAHLSWPPVRGGDRAPQLPASPFPVLLHRRRSRQTWRAQVTSLLVSIDVAPVGRVAGTGYEGQLSGQGDGGQLGAGAGSCSLCPQLRGRLRGAATSAEALCAQGGDLRRWRSERRRVKWLCLAAFCF